MAESVGLSWYDTGTIKLTQNSTAVTGTNTTWSSAGIKAGDILTIDDTKMYQIASVNSNTSLTLKKVYGEASGTNVNYSIIRNFAATVPSELAARVASLVNKYESYIDADLTKITGPAADFSEQYKGTWATGKSYKAMDMVIHDDKVYIAKASYTSNASNAPGASATQWLGLYEKVPVDAIGTLSALTTNDKATLVGAVNEVDAHAGTISALTTSDKSSLVAAVNELDAQLGDPSSFEYDTGGQSVADILHVARYAPNFLIHQTGQQGSVSHGASTEFTDEDKAAISEYTADKGCRLGIGRSWLIPFDLTGFGTNYLYQCVATTKLADPESHAIPVRVIRHNYGDCCILCEGNFNGALTLRGLPSEYYDITTVGYANCTLRQKYQEVFTPALQEFFGDYLTLNRGHNAIHISNAVNDDGVVSGKAVAGHGVELPTANSWGYFPGNGNPEELTAPAPARWLTPWDQDLYPVPMREVGTGGKMLCFYKNNHPWGGGSTYGHNYIQAYSSMPAVICPVFYFVLSKPA